MIHRLLPLALVAALAGAAHAEDLLATYATHSGSLPPEYAWATAVKISTDGQLSLRHCRGYETEGPACKTRKAKVDPAALQAIRDAALASGLATNPARAAEYPMVGGSATSGVIHLDGAEIRLPSDPHEDDAARVAPVLRAIAVAIPPHLGRFLTD